MKITKPIRYILGIIVATGWIAAVGLISFGCGSTPPATIAFKGEVATDTAVRVAMIGWGGYVAAKHPGTNAELRVLHAFKSVQAGELVLIDATASFASNPTNTAPMDAARSALEASKTSFFTLLSSITNTVH